MALMLEKVMAAVGVPPRTISRDGTSSQGTPQDAMYRQDAMVVASSQPDPSHFLSRTASSTFPTTQGIPSHEAFQPMGATTQSPQSAIVYGPSPAAASDGLFQGHSQTPAQGDAAMQGELPVHDILFQLVKLFFEHIHPWCPILHRDTTMEALFSSKDRLGEEDRILLHAIVASTLRYLTDTRLDETKKKHYHDLSKNKVLLYGMDNLSVRSLQALVILALDLIGSSSWSPGWNIMALITRAVVQLGLASESASLLAPKFESIYTERAMAPTEPKDFVEEESRRRLFWMVYLLDRYGTVSTAFDFALSDKDIVRTLPCRDHFWSRNEKIETPWFKSGDRDAGSVDVKPGSGRENLGAFAHYISVLGILSKIHEFLKQRVDITAQADVDRWAHRYKELDDMLARWEKALPVEYGKITIHSIQTANKPAIPMWVMLRATYHTAVIRLHSLAAYPPTKSAIFQTSVRAIRRCQDAAQAIERLTETVKNHKLLNKLGPTFAFTLWVTARLLLVHGSTVRQKLPPELTFFVETLREMGGHWPVAGRYSDTLQRVLDDLNQAGREGGGELPNSAKHLANMRHTAFDLDWLISQQPQQTHYPPSRMQTPARQPGHADLVAHDTFAFFSWPRPAPGEHLAPQAAFAQSMPPPMDANGTGMGIAGVPAEFLNFGPFTYEMDQTNDWLYNNYS
jgi:hypothetical protein